MRNFYTFLTEAEPLVVVEAEAPLYDYQRQIMQSAAEITSSISRQLKMSFLTQRDYPAIAKVRIRKNGGITKVPLNLVYEENKTKGEYDPNTESIKINSYYFDENNWSNSNITETISHEINHAVDHINGELDNKVLTHSKFRIGEKQNYWYSKNEFSSICVVMQNHMESMMRGFTIEGKGKSPESIVSWLEEYVEKAKRDIELSDWRRKRTPAEDSELMQIKRREKSLMVALFGKESYVILLKWWNTPNYARFVEYMDGLAKNWKTLYV